MEELVPSSHNCEAPFVTRTDYTLTDVSDDDFVRVFSLFVCEPVA